MTPRNGMSRRSFLQGAGSLSGAAYLRLASPAIVAISQAACSVKEAAAPFRTLNDAEARDLSAIAARIIPTTDTPGATEAGVIYFMDSAFTGEMSDVLARAREGLAGFNVALAGAHPGKESLADLEEAEQDAFLASREDTDFFNLVRIMTIFGFFAMPKYGGNKHHVAWDLIGFEGHHGAWQYPFGHYDAEAHGETTDGG